MYIEFELPTTDRDSQATYYALSVIREEIHDWLEKHPEKLDDSNLSANPNAMHLLFTLNYLEMRQQNEDFREELCAFVFHPDRMIRFSKGLDFHTYLSLFA